jgi:S1-C subfamily serine protease
MKSIAAAVLALVIPSVAAAQEDDRVKRIVDRIEKEIRQSHERTLEDLRGIIRAEIQKSQGKTPEPARPAAKKVYLGIMTDDLTEGDRKALGGGSGIKVSDVRGPAKDAGVKAGDILVELDGEAVGEDKLAELLAKHKPGDEIDAVVLRSKKRVPLKIVLGEKKD